MILWYVVSTICEQRELGMSNGQDSFTYAYLLRLKRHYRMHCVIHFREQEQARTEKFPRN
jgi:hypothetical protein